jgi:spore coat polysaccharide biosynthesis protein SpsF
MKKCFVLGISEIHETLGKFASKLFDIPYLGSLTNLNQNSFHSSDYPMNYKAEQWKGHKILELNAHLKILKWIQNQT